MRQYLKDEKTRDAVVALSQSAFTGSEKAPPGVVAGIYDRGIVFTRWRYYPNDPPLAGAALVTTDDQRFNEPYIWMIAVEKECRGQGVGKGLLDDVRYFAQAFGATGISLMVNADNVDAIRLYLKENYRIKRFVPKYYGTNDGLVMRRII